MRMVLACMAMLLTALQGVALEERRVVRIVAERFAFSPSQVDLGAGEEIELVVRSDDTSHGIHIAGTDVNSAIPKRGSGEIRIVVKFDEPGRYPFECSRMCGAGHDFMRGEFVVRARTTAAEQR
jgi:cytochrome c oxidase subunit II